MYRLKQAAKTNNGLFGDKQFRCYPVAVPVLSRCHASLVDQRESRVSQGGVSASCLLLLLLLLLVLFCFAWVWFGLVCSDLILVWFWLFVRSFVCLLACLLVGMLFSFSISFMKYTT